MFISYNVEVWDDYEFTYIWKCQGSFVALREGFPGQAPNDGGFEFVAFGERFITERILPTRRHAELDSAPPSYLIVKGYEVALGLGIPDQVGDDG